MRKRILVIALFIAAMLAFYALFPGARLQPAPTGALPAAAHVVG